MNSAELLLIINELLTKNQFSDGKLKGQFGTNTDLISRKQYHESEYEDVSLTPQMFLTYMGLQALRYMNHPNLVERSSWIELFVKSWLSDGTVKTLIPFQSPERDEQLGDYAINYRHTAMAHSILLDLRPSKDIAKKIIDDLIADNVQLASGGWPEWSYQKDTPNVISSVYLSHFLFKFQNIFPKVSFDKPLSNIIRSTLLYLESIHIDGFWHQSNRDATIRFYPTLYLLMFPILLYYEGKDSKIIKEYPNLVEHLSLNGFIQLNNEKKIYRTTLRYTLNLYFHSYFSKNLRVFFQSYRDNLLKDILIYLDELNSHELFAAGVLLDSIHHFEIPDNECFHIFFENSRLIGSSLINRLKNTKLGKKDAHDYHNLILEIFNFLFHRILSNPQKEQMLDGGIKRADIVYYNAAQRGFFADLFNKYNVPCPYVIVECKNYKNDIENPEYDQLCGRFSLRSGMFGIITCRNIINKKKAMEHCKKIVDKGKGYIMTLVDDDIINLIEMKIEEPGAIDSYLENKMREVLL